MAEGSLWLSWGEAWGLLRKEGWQRHLGVGIDQNTYYVAPNVAKVRGVPVGLAGKHFFTNAEAAVSKAQRLQQRDEEARTRCLQNEQQQPR